jgi:succinate-acetate transporter protein
MMVAAAKTSTAVFSVFVVLLVTFILLTTRNWGAGHTELVKISGYLRVLTALPAWYASPAGAINDTHGKFVLPVGPRKTHAR